MKSDLAGLLLLALGLAAIVALSVPKPPAGSVLQGMRSLRGNAAGWRGPEGS